MTMNLRLKINQRTQPVSQALDPQLKRKNSRQMTKPQKNAVGDQIALFANPRRGREQGTAAKEITKNAKTTGQKTQYFKPKHDKSQAAIGNRNGEVKFQI